MNSFETEKRLIAIIRAALHGQQVKTDDLSKELGYLAKRNKVFNLVYLGTGNERAKKRYKEFFVQATAQEEVLAKMTALFEENAVFLMPVKGIQTKKRYPKPEQRSMNDVDVLCKPAQYKQVHRLMKTIGYDVYRQGRKHEAYFFAPHVTVEVHRDLIDGESEPFHSYYRNIWEKAVPKSGYRFVYELTPEDEYIFNIVHLAQHFREGGAGIRFFADVYVYEHTQLNREYVNKELASLGLLPFYQNCRALSLYWFGTEKEQSAVGDTSVLAEMEEYIFGGGLFGNRKRQFDVHAQNGALYRARHSLFPNYNSMKSMYPWLKPGLLPIAWGLRGLSAVKTRKDNVKTVLEDTAVGDKNAGEKLERFYHRCGLE